MRSIGFENFRSLKNLKKIEFKDLTVLVGKNSCGKSTFLRTFPLLKQTITPDRSIPILWYSESLVDFGDYSKVKNISANEDENISLFFENEIRVEKRMSSIKFFDEIQNNINYYVQLSISNDDVIDFIKIEIDNNIFLLNFDKELKLKTIKIDDISIEVDSFYSFRNGILPFFTYLYRDYYDFLDEEGPFKEIRDFIMEEISTLNIEISSEKIDKKLEEIIKNNNYLKEEEFYMLLNKSFKAKGLFDNKNKKIYSLFLLLNFNIIYRTISSDIEIFFSNSVYIAPIRATPQRYYRIQGLAVENVDSTGRNLSLFLKSLSKRKFKELKEWINLYFSFSLDIENIEGHITINIVQNGKTINLTDTGFGYSQLLPIIVQIWYISTKRNRYYKTREFTFVIEQPELHLHPALQIKLIDSFIEIIRVINTREMLNIKFIIETHSETFINRIGENIWKNKLDREKVVIYRFEKKDFETEIYDTKYNLEGILEKWPIGFFSSEDEDDFWN